MHVHYLDFSVRAQDLEKYMLLNWATPRSCLPLAIFTRLDAAPTSVLSRLCHFGNLIHMSRTLQIRYLHGHTSNRPTKVLIVPETHVLGCITHW